MVALGCHSQDLTQPPALGSDQAPLLTSDLPAETSELPPFPGPGAFVPVVDYPLFPLPLGRRLIHRGTEDGESETVITEVTRGHKTILGVPVVVVLDRVFLGGKLKEKTLDWFAQDNQGNVWYFGEDTKEFEDGKVISTAGSFEAGKEGAKAGIIMRVHPKLGQVTPQESAPASRRGQGKGARSGRRCAVPSGTLSHCLKTAEFTPLEPDALENKFYCPGIGIVSELDGQRRYRNTGLVTIIDD
jgi:hypothetical protein